MADDSIYVSISPALAGPIVQSAYPSASTPWVTVRFHATVHNDPSHRGVTWEIAQGGGNIDDRGEYWPPVEPPERAGRGHATIRATAIIDPSKFAEAVVTF